MSNINKYFAPIWQLRGCRIICGAAGAWGGKGGTDKKLFEFFIP